MGGVTPPRRYRSHTHPADSESRSPGRRPCLPSHISSTSSRLSDRLTCFPWRPPKTCSPEPLRPFLHGAVERHDAGGALGLRLSAVFPTTLHKAVLLTGLERLSLRLRFLGLRFQLVLGGYLLGYASQAVLLATLPKAVLLRRAVCLRHFLHPRHRGWRAVAAGLLARKITQRLWHILARPRLPAGV